MTGLHGMFGSSLQSSSYACPTHSLFVSHVQDQVVFILCPFSTNNCWIKIRPPPFSYLLQRSAWNMRFYFFPRNIKQPKASSIRSLDQKTKGFILFSAPLSSLYVRREFVLPMTK